jgi:AcrR family transcriptional regulator
MVDKRRRRNSRQAVLTAAETIVAESGTASLTMDAVALTTGIGKGGVLYHFPFKSDLLKALLAIQCEKFERGLDHLAESKGGGVRAWLEGMIELGVNAPYPKDRLGVEIFAATASDPDLHEPTSEYFLRRAARIWQSCDNPGLALVIGLAVDSLISFTALSAPPIDERSRDAVRFALLQLLDQIEPKQTDGMTVPGPASSTVN